MLEVIFNHRLNITMSLAADEADVDVPAIL
jgi:hypothetical protein